MPCFKPRKMYQPANGGRWLFSAQGAAPGVPPIEGACGGCQGCLRRRTGEWVTRNLWELQRHDAAFFGTFTLANEHLPEDYSVDIRTVQRFIRTLRQWMKRNGHAVQIRYFGCGEYGEENTKRPHYHILFYGWVPPDLEQIENSQSGLPQWQSAKLSQIWGKGRVVVGEVSYQSISYVAGYVFQKYWGDRAKLEYSGRVHPITGEVVPMVRPPFNFMSRKPGIGGDWYDEFKDTDALSDFVIRGGRKRPMPRAITRKVLAALPDDAAREAFKAERRAKIAEQKAAHAADNTPSRLATREVVQVLQAQSLGRASPDWTPEKIEAALEEIGEQARRERSGEYAQALRIQAALDARMFVPTTGNDDEARARFDAMEKRAAKHRADLRQSKNGG